MPERYRLELRHLRSFVAVAEEGSFTRAAARLRIAQPPLSRQIQQLEAELGVTLIERGSRPARLTDAGRVLFEQAVQILDRAAGMRAVAVFTAASESFTKRNINMTIYESLKTFATVVRDARREGMWVRAYVSTAFGCPYEGDVSVEAVVRVASALAELGVDEISIGDTIGVATPRDVVEVAGALQAHMPVERLAMHFHDTRGTALANVVAALQMKISIFDSSAGGLGGCPYAPGATGNLATEDLLYMLDGMGIETGVSLDGVRAASRFLAGAIGREPVSRAYRALEAAAARA